MTKPAKPLITGQCHCGAVKYQSMGPIFRQGECNCRACQRATGTLGSPNVGVKSDTFKVTQGSPAQYKAASNEECDAGTWNFCVQCGAPLYWQNPDGFEIAILVGSLDDTRLYQP
jgi:hypothetical protein